MSSKSLALKKQMPAPSPQMAAIEQILVAGDLGQMNESQRVAYYKTVCETVGLNPVTRPFDYIRLSGKLVLYANKGCAEQLRQIHAISIRITSRETIEGVYVVTAQAERKSDGRVDEDTGAVPIQGLRGDALANAMLKCATKAKRRVTLSICGLNMLDETEVETIGKTDPPRIGGDRPGPEDGTEPDEPEEFRFRKGTFAKRGLADTEQEFGLERMRKWVAAVEERLGAGKQYADEAIWREDIEVCARYIAGRENAPEGSFVEFVGEGIG